MNALSLYKRILNQLIAEQELSDADLNKFDNLKSSSGLETAYKNLHKSFIVGDKQDNWNKAWQNDILHGWYGELVTAQPLRLVALEIEQNESLCAKIRKSQTVSLVSPSDKMEIRVDRESQVQHQPFVYKKLIQRINLDQRERPFIEKWRWAGNNGFALLSDDGRIHIKKDLVWTRIVDELISSGIDRTDLINWLNKMDPDSKLIEIPPLHKKLHFFDVIEFYGFGGRWSDGISLVVEAGSVPQYLAGLYL